MNVPRRTRWKRLIFLLSVTGCILVSVELVAFVGLMVLERVKNIRYEPIASLVFPDESKIVFQEIMEGTHYIIHSPDLGWTIKPHGVWNFEGDVYRANAQGIRGDREYAKTPPPGIIRLSAYGDSMTHADGVRNADTWTEQLNRLHPQLEVLNFGVPAYGPDQAFLRYQQMTRSFDSHIILICFMSENIVRLVNTYRPFLYQGEMFALGKPRFTVKNDRLVLINNPLSGLKDYEGFFEDPLPVLRKLNKVKDYEYFFPGRYVKGRLDILPSIRLIKLAFAELSEERSTPAFEVDEVYNTGSEAFLVTTKLLEEFYQTALANSQLPIIVLLPEAEVISIYRLRGKKSYGPLVAHLEDNKYRYLDLLKAFQQDGASYTPEELCPAHYSALGNKIVAKYIARYLQQNGLLDLSGIQQSIHEESVKQSLKMATAESASFRSNEQAMP